MLNQITPTILTYNEAPNLERTLQQLSWAQRIVIVDSQSTDATLEIAARYPQVEVFQRKFDSLANQWNYAIEQVQTDWVMSLDADYYVTDELQAEMANLSADAEYDCYWIPLKFCVFGKPLRGSILPPRRALFHKERAFYIDDGHRQLLQCDGPEGELQAAINHDDRKSIDRWLWAQSSYAKLEVEKLQNTPESELGLNDRIRKLKVIAPFAILFYYLLLRGGIRDGLPGIIYAFQRVIAEMILSIQLIEATWAKQAEQSASPVMNQRTA